MDYKERYLNWLENPSIDEATKEELRSIAGNETEIEERFFQDLEFGTAGLRGVIGAGTNRTNQYTVGKANQGLANYIIKKGKQDKGVAISFDSRHMSKEFTELSALILNANGIKTYVFETLHPTPMLSFAVRYYGCTAGIMITASHNPREYNGYKAYWSDGCQVSAPKDKEIIDEVNAVTDFNSIKKMDKAEAIKAGLYNVIPESFDDEYMKKVMEQSLNSDLVKSMAKDFTIVYTPLNGTGNIPVRRILSMVGFENVFVVPEQEMPDGDFTTVPYPNPEDPKAFEYAIKLAKEKNADIIVGTDPDADRMGSVVKNKDGSYSVISGNMAGALLADYVLSQRTEKGLMPKNPALIKTIVTSRMTNEIAKKYNTTVFDVLTGFKHIAGKIRQFDKTHDYNFVFGFEESFGYLSGDYVRDKDAVVATMLICELAALYKSRGLTLADGIEELYQKYGYFGDRVKSLTLTGLDGLEKIHKIMVELRKNQPKELGGIEIAAIGDYQTGDIMEIATGKVSKSDLPSSDVLQYTLADGSWICIRPSGTEPKIKIYTGTKADTMDAATALADKIEGGMLSIIDKIIG